MDGDVCKNSFGLEPAVEKDDIYADYIETRKISNAFNFAVEQSIHCYLGGAPSETDWCGFFLSSGQVGLVAALNELATCPLCEQQGIKPIQPLV